MKFVFIDNKNLKIRKLILANDSIYVLPGIEKTISDIQSSGEQYQGLTEVYEYHYHVGSHFLAFGESVLQSDWFRRFWRGYKPLSTRKHSIWKGEVGLTETLIQRAGFVPRILFDANDPGALVDAIRRLVDDPAYARRLGAAGCARAKTRSWSAVLDGLLDDYSVLVSPSLQK